jgi:hypothetical protein
MKKAILQRLNFAISILKSPEKEFSYIEKKGLNNILGDYLVLLLISGFFAGSSTFLLNVFKSLYFDFFLRAEIDYFGMLNYSIGIAVSVFFLYIFLGTVFLLILSFTLKLIFLKMDYIKLLKSIIYSAMPLLLFGWIPKTVPPLILWSLFLLVIGLKK